MPSADAPQGYLYVVLRGEMFDFVDAYAEDWWDRWFHCGTLVGNATIIRPVPYVVSVSSTNADGTLNLVHLAAWLAKEMGHGD